MQQGAGCAVRHSAQPQAARLSPAAVQTSTAAGAAPAFKARLYIKSTHLRGLGIEREERAAERRGEVLPRLAWLEDGRPPGGHGPGVIRSLHARPGLDWGDKSRDRANGPHAHCELGSVRFQVCSSPT